MNFRRFITVNGNLKKKKTKVEYPRLGLDFTRYMTDLENAEDNQS